jgi:hypothetical protein
MAGAAGLTGLPREARQRIRARREHDRAERDRNCCRAGPRLLPPGLWLRSKWHGPTMHAPPLGFGSSEGVKPDNSHTLPLRAGRIPERVLLPQ